MFNVVNRSLKQFTEDSRYEISGAVRFSKVRLTCSLYNFAHFLVAIVKSLTTIAFVCYWAACAQLLVPVLNVSKLFSKLFQHDYLRPMCKPAVPQLLRVWLICNNIPTVDGDSLVVSEGPNHITYCLNLSHVGT